MNVSMSIKSMSRILVVLAIVATASTVYSQTPERSSRPRHSRAFTGQVKPEELTKQFGNENRWRSRVT